jgi:hypothetical protein
MPRAVALVAVLIAACGGGPSAGAGPAPSHAQPATGASSPAPSGRYGVLDTSGQGSTGQVAVVNVSGHVVASAIRHSRTPVTSGGSAGGATAPELPYESTSNNLVYFLDGDARLRSLAPDGALADVASLPGSARAHVAFAVSPDSSRIAVSVMDYASSPARLSLYVSDLHGGNRTDLLSSTGIYVWPVGWHGGEIVVAVGPAFVQQGAENPYTAFAGYHLVDPANGARLAEMCTNGAPIGPLTPAGTLCSSGGALSVSGYDGRSRPISKALGPSCLALSPDGSRVACGTQPIMLVGLDGSTSRTSAGGFAQGWIDNQTLVFASLPGGPGQSRLSVLNLRSDVVLPSSASGTFVGTLPGGL